MEAKNREYNGTYEGENLNRVAFPMGGIGAGKRFNLGIGDGQNHDLGVVQGRFKIGELHAGYFAENILFLIRPARA